MTTILADVYITGMSEISAFFCSADVFVNVISYAVTDILKH